LSYGRSCRCARSRAPAGRIRGASCPRARSLVQPCPRQDSNLYAISGTGPSNQPVYQFQHVGSQERHARRGIRTLTGLLPQDPESCASTSSAIRAVLAGSVAGFHRCRSHGAEGSRTPDLLNAIQALSQLSYSPSARPVLSINLLLSGADGTRTRDLRSDSAAL
jgi:hypothetical protein